MRQMRYVGYELIARVGEGGMGTVFQAHDLRLGRTVAIKVVRPYLLVDDAMREMFLREPRMAATVDHPHILPIYEAGEVDGILYIAMRYVEGGDVRSIMRQEVPPKSAQVVGLPAMRAAELVRQAASALDKAHSRGLLHKDVKPGNMLIDPDSGANDHPVDHLYLCDFGISTMNRGPVGHFMGTPAYAPPEQFHDETLDGRADQYSLGCSAFGMLTSKTPFSAAFRAAVSALGG